MSEIIQSFQKTNSIADGQLRRLLRLLHDEVMNGRGHHPPEVDDDYAIPRDARASLTKALDLCQKVIDRLDKINRNSE